jgi:hypothetical protein
MDYQEAIGAGFPFSGFDLDGDHFRAQPSAKNPRNIKNRGDHDVALTEKAVADRHTLG